ncbi:hypothetical protein B0H16DRAFT_1478896 [Mycena metata]|uniref:Uncharacterized protein n=1 Tax=Mycena metata TaxID=1033252 RepID=A0AAD7H6F4_9AGAR|nr:hypothetical protein B0H16DRAFT_1478896 [Mycena metata]
MIIARVGKARVGKGMQNRWKATILQQGMWTATGQQAARSLKSSGNTPQKPIFPAAARRRAQAWATQDPVTRDTQWAPQHPKTGPIWEPQPAEKCPPCALSQLIHIGFTRIQWDVIPARYVNNDLMTEAELAESNPEEYRQASKEARWAMDVGLWSTFNELVELAEPVEATQ